ncbi:hypothetical protein JF781_26940 [Mycobacterium sp. WUMAC-067]|nr:MULTISPECIES: hypothetical protein [unclassified Mycobacterium]MCA2245945.1 hypothetical protein [Mycobacterium sp. WUMAC-067]
MLASLTPGEQREFEKTSAAASRDNKVRELARTIADRSAELNRRLRHK